MTVFQYGYSTSLQERWIHDASGRLIYHGEAEPGVAESSVGWRIRKFSYTGDNYYADKTEWASGTNKFDKEWDERENYDYS